MKLIKQSFSILILMGAIVFASSCDSDSDPTPQEPNLTIVSEDIQVNRAYEDVDYLTLAVLEENGLNARTTNSSICDGAIIDIDEEAGRITLDFGEGCTSNGITRKGKIILNYTGNLLFTGATIVATFEDYEVFGLGIAGIRTITTQNLDIINRVALLEVQVRNGQVTWPDGSFVTYTSDQIREVLLREDENEILITGSASGKSREGLDYTATVSNPLLISSACVDSGILTPSSGVVNFTYEGIQVSVDYGEGLCDQVITVSYPGGAREITLD